MNGCFIMANIDKFPQFKQSLEFLQKIYPDLIRKCPFYKGLFKINATMVSIEDVKKLENEGYFKYPTGYWKTSIKLSNKEDDKIFEFTAFSEYRSPQDLNDKF